MFVFIRNQTMHSLVRSLFIIRAKSKYFVLRPSLANVFSLFRFRFTKCVQRHSIFGVDLMCVACLGFFSVLFFFGLSMLLYLVWMFRFKPSSARYPVAIYGVCSISNLKVFSCFLVLKRRTKLFHESVYSQWIFLCFLFFFRSIFLDFLLVTIRVVVFFSSVFRLYILCLSCLVLSAAENFKLTTLVPNALADNVCLYVCNINVEQCNMCTLLASFSKCYAQFFMHHWIFEVVMSLKLILRS